jgi:tetratricopeptide (TPR) repeat protein
VIELEPENSDIWLEYSHLLIADNRQDEALELINNGLVFHPDNAELLYRLSCYHYLMGNISEAYQVFSTALDKNIQLSSTVFEYAPAMENDRHIIELIEIYKNKI